MGVARDQREKDECLSGLKAVPGDARRKYSAELVSSREDSRPSWQHYPQDWMADNALRSVSLAARGLWMDMLCIAWQSPIRGKLLYMRSDNKSLQQMDNKMIARLVGAEVAEVAALLEELAAAGVYSVDDDGVIYSRRQLRECTLSEKRAAAGRIGMARRWANKEGANRNNDNPSSSTSSSTSKSNTKPIPKGLSNERGGDVTSIGSALGSGFGDFKAAEDGAKKGLWRRVAKIQPKGPWLEWWRELLPRIWEHGEALTELYDAVKHVEDSLSEELREAKGIGAAEAPDRLLVSKALELCRRHKVAWPAFPAQRTPKRAKSRTSH